MSLYCICFLLALPNAPTYSVRLTRWTTWGYLNGTGRTTSNFGIKLKGNIVAEVNEGSPAGRNNKIKVGDVICSINGVEVPDLSTSEELADLLKMSGKTVHLELMKGERLRIYEYITIDSIKLK